VTSPIETAQIAPTVLAALGLDSDRLTAVREEHTQILPGFDLDSGKSPTSRNRATSAPLGALSRHASG